MEITAGSWAVQRSGSPVPAAGTELKKFRYFKKAKLKYNIIFTVTLSKWHLVLNNEN